MKAINSSHYLLDISLKNNAPEKGYPFDLSAVINMETLVFHPKVTFLVGENGTGKSTLLEAIALSMGLNAEGGSKNFNFSTAKTHSDLNEHLATTKGIHRPKDSYFLRAESHYNLATNVDKLYEDEGGKNTSFGGKSLHAQSHGESFLSTVQNRFRGNGLYILDEPEAALSPNSQLKFLAQMHELIKKNSQFIIATHSPIIMSYPNSDIYHLNKDSFEKIGLEETEHFQLTKYFLNNRERVLKELFQE